MHNNQTAYNDRKQRFDELYQQFQQRYQQYSLLRLIVFGLLVVAVALSWVYFGPLIGFALGAVGLFVFSRFVKWHLSIQNKATFYRTLAAVNDREIQYANRQFNTFDDGIRYLEAAHPYAVDLDLFGSFSFFQYTNRGSSILGKNKYAYWLLSLAGADDIQQRQDAASELADLLDWRQEFQARGFLIDDDIAHLELLTRWMEEPADISKNKFYQVSTWIMPFWILLFLYLIAFHIPTSIGILLLIYPAWILKKTWKPINKIHHQTNQAAAILKHYGALIATVESQEFESELLRSLHSNFKASQKEDTASTAIGQLSYIIRQLNVRDNFFAIFLNILTLWDIRQVTRLEKWKARFGGNLLQWFDDLATFEAILSLATLRYNHPDWAYPEIDATANAVVGKGVGHPLIASEVRIGNDFELPVKGHIKLITGSNMAGKSTFLRTVGLNIVLAGMGAPVCAAAFKTPLLQVYTSMRTQDALHESTSSFFAELKRLRVIIEAVEKGENIFFLLDEILKGTNSRDRHTGSKALIQQLIDNQGAGIIATHDLELGKLEATSNGTVENWRIEVEIKDGELFFDYKVKPGVSESFNATLLMRRMGIRV